MRTFRHRRVRPPAKYLREGLRRSIPYYGIAAITVAQGSVERFALQVFLGPSAVGYFTFFQSMANTVTSITQVSVGNVTYPKVLFEFGPRGHERLHYLRQVLRKTWFVVLLSSFVVLVATTTIVVGLSKLEYVAVMWLLFPLIIGQAVLAASQPLQVALFASHDDRFLLKLMATTGLLSIVLNVFLVPAFGLVGAATVPMSVAVLIGLARVIRVRRVISIA
jgi:O-antigen/teichoic acid export membrane protein